MTKKEVRELIDEVQNALQRQACTDVGFAHCFGLPLTCLAEWHRSGKLRPEEIAFLRLYVTMPWLMHVAEDQFDRKRATQCLLLVAARTLTQAADQLK